MCTKKSFGLHVVVEINPEINPIPVVETMKKGKKSI